MKYRYSLDQIIKFNHGSIQDSEQIIKFYNGNGLIKIHNNKEKVFLSDTLKPKDLRLKSRFRKGFELLEDTESIGGILIKWFGWFIFLMIIVLQYFKSN